MTAPSAINSDMGARIRTARQARYGSLEKAAAASAGRYKPGRLSSYERGTRAITVEQLYELAGFLGTSPVVLLPGLSQVTDGLLGVAAQIRDLVPATERHAEHA